MASKDVSVAPKERVNITYKSAVSGEPEKELPLKFLVLGDFTGRRDDRSLADRDVMGINKNNFDQVMAGLAPSVTVTVPDKLSNDPQALRSVTVRASSMKDFSPAAIAESDDALRRVLEVRKALVFLKGPLGNAPAFRKRLEAILNDSELVNQLMNELKLDHELNSEQDPS
ncbi:MAG: type VI secretion system contractile sheath small subunit [Phycisphaeraceae bacterium]|nr:MAG: type VI secretion system contractile sheath small subunit [Phycisphaeraceae bacterium]